jgi:PAS domain S-box-containing protein
VFASRVAERAPLLLVYLDSDLTVRFVSRHSRELLGHSPDALVGKPLAELVDPGTLRYARRHADDVERGHGALRDYVLRNRCGARRTVMVHAVADRDDAGRSCGYVACTWEAGEAQRDLLDCRADLDRILATALALAAEVDQRRRLDRSRTQLLIRLAHELHARVALADEARSFPTDGDGAP